MYSSFASILAGVLFVSSQTTAKSYTPRCVRIFDKNPSNVALALRLVFASFGSNKNGLPITAKRSLRYAVRRATFTRSRALALAVPTGCGPAEKWGAEMQLRL